MKTVTVNEMISQISDVMKEVKEGYQVKIYDDEDIPLAVLVPVGEALTPRKWHPGPYKIGMYDGIGTFKEVGDGRMTLEEFLGEEA
jgi:antitoxin (DNA-binding transcriptional repressor) of toxin-antitoxin stability system